MSNNLLSLGSSPLAYLNCRNQSCILRKGESALYHRTRGIFSCFRRRFSNSDSGDRHVPLRILYCGSDQFSCSSLQALHREYQHPSSNIASIDVVCREGKRHGRGLKSIRHRMYSIRPRRLVTEASKRKSRTWPNLSVFPYIKSRLLLGGRYVYNVARTRTHLTVSAT